MHWGYVLLFQEDYLYEYMSENMSVGSFSDIVKCCQIKVSRPSAGLYASAAGCF